MKDMTPADWLERIDSAIRYKKEFGASENWGTYRDYYRGIFPGWNAAPVGGPGDFLPYNLVYMFARVTVPSVYFRNPYVMVSPRPHWDGPQQGAGRDVQAKVIEAVDNWLLQEMGIKQTIKSVVLDTFLCGRGIIKVGFDSEFALDPDILDNPSLSVDGQKDKKGHLLEWNADIKPGMPWAQRVDPDMFLTPYAFREMRNFEWVDHIILRDLDALKADPRMKTDDIEGTHLAKIQLLGVKSQLLADLERKINWVETHEIRDRVRGEVLLMTSSAKEGKLLLGPNDDVLQIEGLPYVDLCFNEDPDYYWAASDARIMEPQQLEINQAVTQAMRHRQIALLKFIPQKGAFTPDELAKLQSGEVGVFAESKLDPNASIMQLQPHVPPDIPAWIEAVRMWTRELLGIGRLQLGESEKGSRRTAKEATITQMAHDLRMGEKRDACADMLQVLVRKINQIAFKLWSPDRVTQVVGYDGARYWVKYDANELSMEYDLKVDVESMLPQTKQLRRQELVQVIKALGNNPRVNIDYLMRMLAREFDWLDVMRVLPEAPETAAGPMSMQEFGTQQGQMLNNPALLQARVGKTAGALSAGGQGALA